MEDKSRDLINKTIELNKEYKKLLKKFRENPVEENWNNAYIANQKWWEAVKDLKNYNIILVLDIGDQFNVY